MTITIDVQSLLVSAPGDATLEAIEEKLAARGLTLGVAPSSMRLDAWIAAGTPGAPSVFADPADHVLAGLEATLPDGRNLVIHDAPRRAVGPDLAALALGTKGFLDVRVVRASLRVHRVDTERPIFPLPGVDLDPPLSDAERGLLAKIATELARPPS